jgi:hypothetical protein
MIDVIRRAYNPAGKTEAERAPIIGNILNICESYAKWLYWPGATFELAQFVDLTIPTPAFDDCGYK